MKTQRMYVSGMTCSSCEKDVKEALETLEGVAKATPSYQTGEVEIMTTQHIATADVKAVLPKKFTLQNEVVKQPSKLKQLFPLFLIFAFIIGAVLVIHYGRFHVSEMMLDFMGMFFLVFSFFKFLDLDGFQSSFRKYDPLAAALPFYGWIYPFLELGLGICYIRDFVPNWVLICTLLVLGITTIGVLKSLVKKNTIQCACLGSVLNLPMTEATFIENAIMLVMAGSLLG